MSSSLVAKVEENKRWTLSLSAESKTIDSQKLESTNPANPIQNKSESREQKKFKLESFGDYVEVL